MKWGMNKSWNSPSRTSAITRVFPVSWFSKFKPGKSTNLETSSTSVASTKRKQRGKLDFPTPNSYCNWKEGRFYSMDDDDAFWRLSFSDERIEGRRSTGGINPLWYDSDDDGEFRIPISRFKGFGLKEMELPRREGNRNFNDMVSDIKKMKEKQNSEKVQRQSSISPFRKNMEAEMISRWKKDSDDRKASHRQTMREKQANVARDVVAVEPERTVHQMRRDLRKSPVSSPIDPRHKTSSPSFNLSPIEEDYAVEVSKEEGSSTVTSERLSVSDWQNLQEKNFLKEMKVKTGEFRGRKIKQNKNRVVKAHSPRTECKIRALEDMKKARMKLKKKRREEEEVLDGRTVFDSFAVAKSSYNPQQDFRDSMVEMISQKGIRRPEELEELLACYLTLNCDEYHDLIIKVFRQVWFELNGVCDDPEIHDGQCYYDWDIV